MSSTITHKGFPFTKMHHCGNDYIYIDFLQQGTKEKLLSHLGHDEEEDNFKNNISFPELFASDSFKTFVQETSHRRFGIGSDGVICLVPPPSASSSSATSSYDVKMKMFNADASVSSMCGNGLISLAALYCLHGHHHSREKTITIRIATDESEKDGLYSLAKVEMENNDNENVVKSVEIKIIQEPILDALRIPCCCSLSDSTATATESNNEHPMIKSGLLQKAPIFFNLKIEKEKDEDLFSKLAQHFVMAEEKTSNVLSIPVYCIGMGNPHAIIVIDRMMMLNNNNSGVETSASFIRENVASKFPLEQVANKIVNFYNSSSSSSALFFPEGVNVSLAVMFKKEIKNGCFSFSMVQRTFERGSGETLACGSGSCACVVASSYHHLGTSSSTEEKIKMIIEKVDATDVYPPGGRTRVQFSKNEGVLLSGVPKVVFRGEVY